MKKIKKKSLLAILMLLIMLVSAVSIGEVSANPNTEQIVRGELVPGVFIQRNYGTRRNAIQARILYRASDRSFVYCLEPAVVIDENAIYQIATENQWEIQDITEEQWERAVLIAYYGYGFGNHTQPRWWAITQVMIWWVVAPEWDVFFTNGIWGERITPFNSEIAQINRLVDNHMNYPSFHDTRHNLGLGGEIVLNDTNNVLEYFRIISNNNLTATRSGNNLRIRANNPGLTTLRLERSDSRFNEPPFVYFHPVSQNFMSVGSFASIEASVRINVIAGEIKVDKIDNDTGTKETSGKGTLAGAVYDILDENGELISQITTNVEGVAIIENLPLGRYYIIETTASYGYLVDEVRHYVDITENNLEHIVTSRQQIIRGRIKVDKVDYDNESKLTWGEATLKGAVYDIFNHHNELVYTITTNEGGYAVSKLLPFGKYYIKERSASQGYLIDLTRHEVFIRTEGNTYEVRSYQQVIRRNIEILKSYSQLQTGLLTPEVNVLFHIYNRHHELVAAVTTDEFGFAYVTGLPYGNYILRQKTASEGTEKKGDINFIVNDTSPNVIRFNIVNNVQIIEVPETLLNDIGIYLTIGYLLIGIGLIYIIYKKLRRKKVSFSLLLIIAGLLFVAYNYYDILKEEYQTERRIEQFFAREERIDNELINNEEISYIAILEIPTINLKRGLVSPNAQYNNVEENIAILAGSTFPNGDASNLILAAHSGRSRVSFFSNLYQINLGDNVYFYFNNSKYIYQVIDIYTQPREGYISVRERTHDMLTLTTCKDRYYQLIVIGKLNNQLDRN